MAPAFFFKQVVFYLQPADGGVERFHVRRGRDGTARLGEDLRRLLAQLRLPTTDLFHRSLVARGQFGQWVPLGQRGQRYFCFELSSEATGAFGVHSVD